ncbi:hypothetical protein OROGR_014649 [Orobanche gracilis]
MDNQVVYDGSIYRVFYVFFDANNERVDLPHPWVEWFSHRVTSNARLTGDSKNNFNIVLYREGGRFTLTKGIKQLLQHYDLPRGARTTVFYLGGTDFHVQLHKRKLLCVKDRHPYPDIYEFGWSHDDLIEDFYNSGPHDDEWDRLECSHIEICAFHFVNNRKSFWNIKTVLSIPRPTFQVNNGGHLPTTKVNNGVSPTHQSAHVEKPLGE